MKTMSWNCRGLGSPSTIPQLKESLRLLQPELIFLCETKRKKSFVSDICKQLGWGNRWHAVDLVGRSGGLLLGWGTAVTVHQVLSTSYSIEIELEMTETKGRIWAVFVYASVKEKVRQEQWRDLLMRSRNWGDRWVLGGDFNDIKSPVEKKRGKDQI